MIEAVEIPRRLPSPPPTPPDGPTPEPNGRAAEADRAGALARLLRTSGAVLLLASAATFLLQRWEHGDDTFKYGLLLVQTLVIVAAAFVCGVRVRESRGARTLFALVLAAVPVHFGVLGGLLYSQFALDHSAGLLPKHVIWVSPSPTAALITLGVALLFLVPASFVALLALVRPEAPRFLALFLGMNALLLVPVRDPNLVAIGLAVAAFLVAQLEAGSFRRSIALRTPEGRIARGLLATPLLLLAGRAVWLYHPDLLFGGICLFTLGLALFSLAAKAGSSWLSTLQRAGTALSVSGWVCIAIEASHDFHVPDSFVIPLIGLPVAVLLTLLGAHARPSGTLYRRAALLIAATTVISNLFYFGSVEAALLAIVVGILLLSTGTYRRRLSEVCAGGAAAISGLVVQLHHAINFERWLNWGSLSVLGIALVFLAAFIERHPERLRALVRFWSRAPRDDGLG